MLRWQWHKELQALSGRLTDQPWLGPVKTAFVISCL